jgi:hypothetical protein
MGRTGLQWGISMLRHEVVLCVVLYKRKRTIRINPDGPGAIVSLNKSWLNLYKIQLNKLTFTKQLSNTWTIFTW